MSDLPPKRTASFSGWFDHAKGTCELVATGPAERFETGDIVGLIWGPAFTSEDDLHNRLLFHASDPSAYARTLNSEAAIALFDKRTKRLTLIRDRFGCKPIYWRVIGSRTRFSCDLNDLIADHRPGLAVEPVLDLLSGRHLAPVDQTGFKGVFQVPPAHILSIDAGRQRLSSYWSALAEPFVKVKDRKAHVEKGRRILQNAVAKRLSCAPRTVVEVSGGLDSSAIACIAANGARDAMPKLVSWQDRTQVVQTTDTQMLKRVEQHTNLPIRGASLGADDLLAIREIDPLIVPQSAVLGHSLALWRAVDPAGAMLLTGLGGDQAVSHPGYRLRRRVMPDGLLRLRRRAAHAPDWITPTVGHMLRARPPHGYLQTANLRRAQHVALTLPGLSQRMSGDAWLARQFDATVSYPMLDLDVIRFALSTPASVYRHKGRTRALFRDMLHGILPDQIRERPDKSDPLRFAQTDAAYRASAPLLLDELTHRDLPKDRLAYVDKDRLCRALEAIAKGHQSGRGRALSAAQFLLGTEHQGAPLET